MLFWIIQQIIISVILIISVHYIYIFFKNNLTIPKTKDLVNKPTEQYKKIYKSLNINKENTKEMKNELKNYLKNLHSSKQNNIKKQNIENVGNAFTSSNFTSY
tara:strand:+ start:692 stop:1000 length:309 start_codon:yes stop_codon:yes gene_type:complete